MKPSDFGDRMKAYEAAEAGRSLIPLLPAMARLDGRSFHAFTKHARRPFSSELHALMVATTRFLVEETGARSGYTQSDEISLAWYSESYDSQIFFDGGIQKMVSTLAAMATLFFNTRKMAANESSAGLAWYRAPTFDCRVWNVPTLTEAANVFVWRQHDAVRNSVQMAARAFFSHAQVDGLSCAELQEKLHAERQINWNDYPAAFKRGTFVQRYRSERRFSPEEIARLPEKHAARTNPELTVERTAVRECDLWLTKIANREGALFRGEDPRTEESS